MYREVVICKDSELHTIELVFKFFSNCPFQAQQFQLEGTVVLVNELCRMEATAGIGYYPLFVALYLC